MQMRLEPLLLLLSLWWWWWCRCCCRCLWWCCLLLTRWRKVGNVRCFVRITFKGNVRVGSWVSWLILRRLDYKVHCAPLPQPYSCLSHRFGQLPNPKLLSHNLAVLGACRRMQGLPTIILLANNSGFEIHSKRDKKLLIYSSGSRNHALRLSMMHSAQVFSPHPSKDPRENLRILQSPLKNSFKIKATLQ